MKIHVFPFSPREGTPAAELPDQVSPAVRKDRCDRLAAVERQLAGEYYESLVGSPVEVLVERTSETRPGWVRGTDRRYVPVEVPGDPSEIGKLVWATGCEATSEHLRAYR